ncbi:MAG: helix-turn-helix domain-containing protein [Clostridia bacterium]|nr:helix-turn-helix domain-containing protein [Clostridia bacterium]MBP5511699.1 helix-turn-helix domain-containing protein [Kiritimatiellia bacterium]
MSMCYKKFWKLLIDRDMTRADLRKETGISPVTIAKMSKGEPVGTGILERIYESMQCNIGDIADYVPNGSKAKGREFAMKAARIVFGVAAAVIAATGAYAAPTARPLLPPVEYIDTETVTNVSFTAWEQGLKEFRFDLEFTGSASNNVEMAFGTDADGDGMLSDDEVSVIAGWDCGDLFIENNATDERVSATAAADPHHLSCVIELRSNGRIVNVSYSDSGTPVFPALAAAKPPWIYSTDWNMVRMTGRGENVRSGERFSAKTTPQGFAIRLR